MKEFDELLKDLKNKIYKPVYFLMGDEAYFIDMVTDYIAKHLLTDAEKTFNQLVLYGKDTDVQAIINAARRFPMMANHQVIIVKEAQELVDIENLLVYVEKPLKSTILVLNYKYDTLDKRTKLYKALEHHVCLESKKLFDNKVPDWIGTHLKKTGLTIEAEAAVLLTECLGNDLSRITHELEKLSIIIPQGIKLITRTHIEKNIGISKDYNNFELNKAIGQRNILKVNRIAYHFGKNTKANPLPLTIQTLFGYYSKVLKYHYLADKSRSNVVSYLGVHSFFVAEYETTARNYGKAQTIHIISLLREYDAKSKGVGAPSAAEGELLRELLFKIMHC